MTDVEVDTTVGVVGIVWYSFIAACFLFVIIFTRGSQQPFANHFFCSSFTCCLCEIPRYIMLIIQGAYTSQWAYSLHLIGSWLYFLALSIVILSIIRTFENRDRTFKMIFHVLNGVFFVLVFVAIGFCVSSPSLHYFFFHQPYFQAYTLLDALKNLIFSFLVFAYCLKHLNKVKRYAATLNNKDIEKRVTRLLVVLALCCACLVLRMITLSLKQHVILRDDKHSDDKPKVGNLQLFGLPWSIMDDFIPRGVPLLLFLVTLARRKRAPDSPDLNVGERETGGSAQPQLQEVEDGSAQDPRYTITSPLRETELSSSISDPSSVERGVRFTGISSVSSSFTFSGSSMNGGGESPLEDRPAAEGGGVTET